MMVIIEVDELPDMVFFFLKTYEASRKGSKHIQNLLAFCSQKHFKSLKYFLKKARNKVKHKDFTCKKGLLWHKT